MAGSQLDLNGFRNLLKKDSVQGMFFLYGEESFLIEESVKELIAKSLDAGLRDFNLEIFYGSELECSRLIESIEMLPMMAPHRVVVVRDAEDIKAKELEKFVEAMDSEVSRALETTILIFLASKLDMRSKFAKKISQFGTLVKLDRPFENQLPAWITYISNKNGVEINTDASELLQQLVGVSLLDLDNEIKKIASYLGTRNQIERADVLAVVSRIRIESVFALSHAIGERDRVAALLCLANLLQNEESPLGVLALVARHVRILGKVKECIDERLSSQQMSSRVGVSPYFLKEYVSQAAHWPETKIHQTIRSLHDTDAALKSSPVSAHIWLENFIIQTCDF